MSSVETLDRLLLWSGSLRSVSDHSTTYKRLGTLVLSIVKAWE